MSDPDENLRAELASLDGMVDRTFRRFLTMWAIRWTIGFALVWWITTSYEGWFWLWYAAGAIALSSLFFTVYMTRRASARVREVDDKLRELE